MRRRNVGENKTLITQEDLVYFWKPTLLLLLLLLFDMETLLAGQPEYL